MDRTIRFLTGKVIDAGSSVHLGAFPAHIFQASKPFRLLRNVAVPIQHVTGRIRMPEATVCNLQAGLLQLAAFYFGTIKFWSGFAGDF